MQTTQTLRTLERTIFGTLFIDGLVDLGIGLWLVTWSVLIQWGWAALGGVVPALLIPIWYRLRERWVEPRIGTVRFRSRARSKRLAWVIGGLALALLFGIFLAKTRGSLPPAFEDAISAQSHMLLGGTIALLLVLLAAVFGVGRLAIYAALLVLLFALGHEIGLPFPWSMAAAGTLILLCGIVVLVGFARTYPLAEPEHG